MTGDYIIIGAKKSDKYKSKHEVADHAMHVDTLVKVYKDGKKEIIPYKSRGTNPGVDLVNHINGNHPDCKVLILGQKLQYANNLKKGVNVKVGAGTDIEDVVGNYASGSLYGLDVKKETKAPTPIGIPQRTGVGMGERTQKGRGGHPPEEQEVYGRGSGTKEGRAKEGKPKRTAYKKAA